MRTRYMRSRSIVKTKPHIKFTPRLKKVFLDIFEQTYSLTQACKACQISTSTFYNHKDEDPEFREAWEKVNERLVHELEEEAYRRGVKGVKKPVYYQGRLVGYELEYSDRLLEMMLRARDERYGTKRVKAEHEHKHEINVNTVKDKLMEKALGQGLVLDGESEEIEDQ